MIIFDLSMITLIINIKEMFVDGLLLDSLETIDLQYLVERLKLLNKSNQTEIKTTDGVQS